MGDKKLIFFENLKRLDVQTDINANGRAGFQKAEPAFSPASKSVLAGFKKPAKKPGRLFKKPAVCHSATSQHFPMNSIELHSLIDDYAIS